MANNPTFCFRNSGKEKFYKWVLWHSRVTMTCMTANSENRKETATIQLGGEQWKMN